MNTDFEDRLRADLLSTTSDRTLVGPTPESLVAQGHRALRRRTLTRVGAAVAAVAVVAVGATAALSRSPEEALPATPPHTVSESTTVRVQTSDARGNPLAFRVTLDPGPDGRLEVLYAQETGTGSGLANLGGAQLDPDVPRASINARPGSEVVLGVVPSATAREDVSLDVTDDLGGYSTATARFAGTDWTAFASVFERPLGEEPTGLDLTWFTRDGRPVGLDGAVGSRTELGGATLWLSADGRTTGGFAGDGSSFRRPVAGPDTGVSATVFGSEGDWQVLGLLPEGAVSGAVAFRDGRMAGIATAGLGSRTAFVADGTGSITNPTSVVWVDDAGDYWRTSLDGSGAGTRRALGSTPWIDGPAEGSLTAYGVVPRKPADVTVLAGGAALGTTRWEVLPLDGLWFVTAVATGFPDSHALAPVSVRWTDGDGTATTAEVTSD